MAAQNPLKKKLLEQIEEPHKAEEPSHAPHEEGEPWLISYADMMTLLCGFFIMMFSMAKMNTPEFEGVKESIAKEFKGDYKNPIKENANFLTQVLQEAGVEKDVVVRSDIYGVSLTFSSTVFFDTLSSEVKSSALDVLTKLMDAIHTQEKSSGKPYKIVIEGHTDSRPVLSGTYATNWELSGARASRVVRHFLDRGFTSDRLTAIGYADTYPELPSRHPDGAWNEEALAKNRRVVIRVLEANVDTIPFPEKAQDPTVRAPAAESATTLTPPAVTPPVATSSNMTAPVSAPPTISTTSKTPANPTH